MTSALFQRATAQSAEQGRVDSAHEQAKIGAAAERKRREESELSLTAIMASEEHGRAVRWERRVTVSGETRISAEWERAGAYGEREFLRLANRAAAQAVPGGWKNGEAVEAIGAEIVTRVLAKTYGRMPKRGSLAKTAETRDPDFTYLVSVGRFCVADALEGTSAGLAAEVAPMAAADGDAAASLRDLAEQALAAAETTPETDAYLDGVLPDTMPPLRQWGATEWALAEIAAASAAQPLTGEVTSAARNLARLCGGRPASATAAISAALRPGVHAAEWADAGMAASTGAFRKAASVGRGIVADRLAAIPSSPALWCAADWRTVEAVAHLCELETSQREAAHISEQRAGASYKAPKLPEYGPSQRVNPDEQVWASPADLSGYPSSALKH